MKTKKVLLGSLVLASVFTACTDENIVEGVQNNMPLTERTQVNLSLSTPEIDSRMSNGSGWSSAFETHDVLGAVLVDKGFIADPPISWTAIQWNNVDWTVVNGHVGNNKWFYDAEKKKFITEGTTAVGSWLFYTKYNEKMTTTRNGVEFDFPQIQEGSTNLEWVMNNNANFMVSPVAHIDGYEGQNLDFSIRMASVFNYLRMPFDLKATGATQVQKIVVKAKSDANTDVDFPTEYKVVNTALPQAYLSLDAPSGKDVKCPNVAPTTVYDVTDQNAEMDRAYNELVYATTAKSSYYTKSGNVTTVHWGTMAEDFKSVIASRNAEKDVKYLVVDLDGEHADKLGEGGLKVAADGKFSAVMLMPAGVYYSITFDIYTDKGVFTKTVTDRHAWAANLTEETYNALPQATKNAITASENKIFLRPGRVAVLSDIEGAVAGSNYAETLAAEEYIKVAANDKSTNAQYITKTADLINFINGITAANTACDVNVMAQAAIGGGDNDDELIPEHGVIVNQAVMTAIEKKETELARDIQINLVGATVKVKGNDEATSALNIHDLTFSNGAELISGYVKATESVNVIAKQKMLVKSGVNLELALSQKTQDVFNSLEVENGATVKATTSATVGNLLNKGAFSIAADKTITSATVENKGTATVEGALNVTESLVNASKAALTNKGTMTLAGKATNNGTLTNNKDINVHGAMTNNHVVTIAADAKIHVNSTKTASLLNNGTITNNGMLYTKVGYDNTITNLGTIDAKSASTTYITKNSKADETNTATNASAQIMGTIKIAERNLDITVTNNNYQGYIEYTAVAADIKSGVFEAIESGDDTQDKFNKVIFSSAVKLVNADRVRYIVTNKNLNLVDADVNEVTFTGTATLYAQNACIASLTIAKDVLVKVPTINKVFVKTIKTPSLTKVEIHNEGELLVGGDLYTTILGKEYTTGGGEFSAGDGNETAFHWGDGLSEEKLEEALKNGYQIEGNVATVVKADALETVLADNNVKEVKLQKGEYTLPSTNGDVVISGGTDAIVEIDKPTANKVTFEGVTVQGSGVYTGIQHSNNVEYKNCIVKGTQCLYADQVLFDGCTVDLTEVADYIWTYGAKNVTFQNCVFNTKGKAILIYNESTSLETTVTVTGCTFNASVNADKAAVEIDSSLSTEGEYTLITDGNTVDSNFSGEWRIKKSGENNTVVNGVVYNAVTIDGVKF